MKMGLGKKNENDDSQNHSEVLHKQLRSELENLGYSDGKYFIFSLYLYGTFACLQLGTHPAIEEVLMAVGS